MVDTLGDTTKGIIKSLTDKNADGLAKALAAVDAKIQAGITANNGPADAEITDAEYKAVGTALTAIEESINKALESGDLTQLDTANLKALRMATNELETMFENINEFKPDAANVTKYTVGKDDLDKVKAALENISKAREEAGESATKALASSKAQAENIKEMRTQLQAFAANPKGSELESVTKALENINNSKTKIFTYGR